MVAKLIKYNDIVHAKANMRLQSFRVKELLEMIANKHMFNGVANYKPHLNGQGFVIIVLNIPDVHQWLHIR